MPLEDFEEEGLAKNPNMEQAQTLFLGCTTKDAAVKKDCIDQLIKSTIEENKAPFYIQMCENLSLDVDASLQTKMQASNSERLSEIDTQLKEAEESSGESEVREFLLKRAEYFCLIGDKDAAISAFRMVYEKTVPIGQKLDIIFHQIRMGLFYLDYDLTKRNLSKAKSLIEEGGDWDRRNRLKVYEGAYCMSIRDFSTAAKNFLDTVSTFTSYELMSYKQFIHYTVICSVIALSRVDMGKKVVKCAEILEVMYSDKSLYNFLMSLYNCKYSQFFLSLAELESQLQSNMYLSNHCRYYIREMRIKAYDQLLHSYQSLTLSYMANAFGVTERFIDKELSAFISAGRLDCKIDKVGEVIETNWPDSKNKQYQEIVKKGDVLLNHLQKLRRVVNL